MGRSTRMFEIIQVLRSASGPMTAQALADELEVAKRTIYRDIAALQAMRTPIEGEAGIGYVMRPGFDLPPVNFDVEEAEAITVGLSLIARTGDRGLKRAARRAAQKLSAATQLSETLFASTWGAEEPESVDLSDIRRAIREEQKLSIVYRDGEGVKSHRTILPLAIAYHAEAVILAAWCEARQDFRHFRPDRIVSSVEAGEGFRGQSNALRSEWLKGYADRL
ncbi:MAG: helix-turn-helix transcriptional regulator [Pikeienuella sp.]